MHAKCYFARGGEDRETGSNSYENSRANYRAKRAGGHRANASEPPSITNVTQVKRLVRGQDGIRLDSAGLRV